MASESTKITRMVGEIVSKIEESLLYFLNKLK